MAPRYVVLFARAPEREAREKGLDGRGGEELFAAFAAGWIDAAAKGGARLVLATAAADRPAWRRLFSEEDLLFVDQSGESFGERLEAAARHAASLGGPAVIVGGDVAPSPALLRETFDLLERGADAVLAPAPDGGVSLLALAPEDLDLLRPIIPKRRDVFDRLLEKLGERGRRVRVVALLPDVDGRRGLRSILRSLPAPLRATARRALSPGFSSREEPRLFFRLSERTSSTGLRAPPAAA